MPSGIVHGMTEELNPQQLSAVNHIEGPLLVLAGAGSGKTRIVTFRVAHLLQTGVPSNEILAVTFTNKAADEMRHRILSLTSRSVLTCTFHSLCARILRESIAALGYSRDFVIYDEEDSEKVLKECLASLEIREEKGMLRDLRSQISRAKNALVEPEDVEDKDWLLQKVYDLYQKRLKEYHALDFDDLLFLTVRLFKQCPNILNTYQNRWSFILIDEYQDTNQAQYMITQLLAGLHRNVFAVGDPDQSIYSWRGANIRNILNFEKDFPGAKVIPLEQNYRSRSTILEAANALIRHNTARYEKNLWSQKGEGEKIGLCIAENDHAEADFVVKQLYKLHREKGVPLKDCAIFYRTHFQSRIFEDHLLRENIPYVIVGGISFYQRREVKDILAWLRIVLSGTDAMAFARTINLPKRGLGDAALDRIREFAKSRQSSIYETCAHIAEDPNSIHYCKLSRKQIEGIQSYVQIISSLREMVKQARSLREILQEVLERTRYLDYLREDPESFEERRGNIEELVSKAAEWEGEVEHPSLAAFLEELTLKSGADDTTMSSDHLRMMTLHNGKGLEFTGVFLVGMEEELFPHVNSLENQEALEEERRLCYVGITRAKEYLFLTASRYRYHWGIPKVMRPSRFLAEIPEEFLQPCSLSLQRKGKEDFNNSHEERSFEIGDSVFHRDFGTGTVQKVYQTSLGLTYDVFFSKANTQRSLVARFARLIPSSE